MRIIGLWISHMLAVLLGVAGGIYLLPILTATEPPQSEQMTQLQASSYLYADFDRQRQDSDWLHWGQGRLSISDRQIGFTGQLAPGPDYRLYLSPEFVETEARFAELQPQMRQVGMISGFDGFVLPLPEDVDPSQYAAVVIWCEAFGQFITSGRLQAQ